MTTYVRNGRPQHEGPRAEAPRHGPTPAPDGAQIAARLLDQLLAELAAASVLLLACDLPTELRTEVAEGLRATRDALEDTRQLLPAQTRQDPL